MPWRYTDVAGLINPLLQVGSWRTLWGDCVHMTVLSWSVNDP